MALHLKSTGIDFADFSHAGSMTTELLNDYEHGNWTLAAHSGTGTIGGGGATQKYCKVGTQVSCNIDYVIASGGTLLLGSGLPFANGDDRCGGVIGYTNISSGNIHIYVAHSSSNLSLYIGSGNHTMAQNETIQGCSMLYFEF